MKNTLKSTTAVAFCAAIAFGAGMVGAKSSHASDPFISQIMQIGANFAPQGWAFCDGQLLSIAQNTALFSLLGYTYGGLTTVSFALPDIRGRGMVHPGNGPGLSSIALGEKGGAENTTLSLAHLPSHNHGLGNAKLNASGANGNQQQPGGNYLAPGGSRTRDFKAPVTNPGGFDATPLVEMNGLSISGTTANAGSGQSFTNRSPYIGINHIIALVGIFPSET